MKDRGIQSYEEICNGKTYCGFRDARMTSHSASGDYLKIEYYSIYAPGIDEKNISEISRKILKPYNAKIIRDGDDIILDGLERMEMKILLLP